MSNTPPPATTWVGSMEQEYSTGTANDIADSSGVLLVDASAVFVVDNGVAISPLPATTWIQQDDNY